MPYYYLIVFCVLVLVATLEVFGTISKNIIVLRYFAFFMVFSTSAFRYETGTDWYSYDQLFAGIPPLENLFSKGLFNLFGGANLELGFTILCSAVKSAGGNIQIVYFIIALVNCFLLYKTLKYYSPYPVLCLLFYFVFIFFILDMSGVRQSIALNIVSYGFRYLDSGNNKKYILCVFIAFLFHQSVVLLFFVLPLSKYTLSSKSLSVLYIVTLVFILFQLKWISAVIPFFASFLGGSLALKAVNYTLGGWEGYSFGVKAIFNSCVFFLCIFSNCLNSDRKRNSFILLFFYLILYNLLFENAEISQRIYSYFVVFLGVTVSYCISSFDKRMFDKMLLYSVAVFYCFLIGRVYITETPLTISYYPYQNYVIYKVFDIPSSGLERLNKQYDIHRK